MAMTLTPYYDVLASVGRGGKNLPTDVMLIQYFLTAIGKVPSYFHMELIDPVSGRLRTDWDAITSFNGNCSEILIECITRFQKEANKNGMGPLVVDGIINTGSRGWGRENVKGTRWRTIMAMNEILYNFDKNSFLKLPDQPNLPGPLRADLKTIEFILRRI